MDLMPSEHIDPRFPVRCSDSVMIPAILVSSRPLAVTVGAPHGPGRPISARPLTPLDEPGSTSRGARSAARAVRRSDPPALREVPSARPEQMQGPPAGQAGDLLAATEPSATISVVASASGRRQENALADGDRES